MNFFICIRLSFQHKDNSFRKYALKQYSINLHSCICYCFPENQNHERYAIWVNNYCSIAAKVRWCVQNPRLLLLTSMIVQSKKGIIYGLIILGITFRGFWSLLLRILSQDKINSYYNICKYVNTNQYFNIDSLGGGIKEILTIEETEAKHTLMFLQLDLVKPSLNHSCRLFSILSDFCVPVLLGCFS